VTSLMTWMVGQRMLSEAALRGMAPKLQDSVLMANRKLV